MTDASHPPPPAAGALSPLGSELPGRLLFWLLVLFAAGVLWPFTTSLHNICLRGGSAAAEQASR